MKEATLYKKVEEAGKAGKSKLIQCLACRHYCKIPDGETGRCGVRMNFKGKLDMLVYGYPNAIHLDPMEKKPLNHFLPGKQVFSLGTNGCNFFCKFCQNYDLSQSTRVLKLRIKDKEKRRKSLIKLCKGDLLCGRDFRSDGLNFYQPVSMDKEEITPEKVVDICVEGGIPAIAYTYNEPTIFFEYARDIGVLARKKGIKNVFVSNGYESEECIKACEEFLDAINIDLKAFTEDFYRDVCGATLKGVLATIEKAAASKIWLEVTTLIIPGLNDSEKELAGIANFIAGLSKDIPWHVTAFHPEYKMTDIESTPETDLAKAYEIGKSRGLNYVYTGNILDGQKDTICPKCGATVIERYEMTCREVRIDIEKDGSGKCYNCGEKIAGVFK